MNTSPKKQRKKLWRLNKESEGCEFCGRRVAHIPSGGLEFAHIVAKRHFKKSDPDKSQLNGFMICPSCHKIFDQFIKPKLQQCCEWALSKRSTGAKSSGICEDGQDFVSKLQ